VSVGRHFAKIFKDNVFSQAVQLDNTLYVSGVLGLNKDTMKLVEGGAAAEAREALCSLGHILEEAGSSYDNVVKSTIFLNNIDDFAAVNEVYKECTSVYCQV
jgi:2-iminobutanoate/2-iminopropanoate deaminase